MNESIGIVEACDFLKCSQLQLLQMLDDGDIPDLNFGTAWVIPRAAFFQAVNTLALHAATRRKGIEHSPPPSASPSATDVVPAAPHVELPSLDGASDEQVYAQEFISSLGMSVKFSDSETQKRSRVVESYLHEGMAVLIYEFTGRTGRRDYFAVVADPGTGRQSGELIGPSYSIKKTKTAAAAFARALATEGPTTAQPGTPAAHHIAASTLTAAERRGPGRPRKPRSA